MVCTLKDVARRKCRYRYFRLEKKHAMVRNLVRTTIEVLRKISTRSYTKEQSAKQLGNLSKFVLKKITKHTRLDAINRSCQLWLIGMFGATVSYLQTSSC